MYYRELRHHGIKGMRWGVRRYQNPDGSLTALGRQRYGREVVDAYGKLDESKRALKQQKRIYNRRTLGGTLYNGKEQKALNYAKLKANWAKEDLSSAKIKSKIENSAKDKSKHRMKLEAHYKQKGMTAEEAAVAAYKREQTEKILAVTLGLTVAAAGAYVAYKHHDYAVDKIIKSGTIMSRVSSSGTAAVHDAFYASIGSSDSKAYTGMLAKSFKGNGKDAFQKLVKANEGMKVASEKHALDGLKQIVKSNPSYTKELEKTFRDAHKFFPDDAVEAHAVVNKGMSSLKAGKIDRNVYNALNLNFIQGRGNSEAVRTFYDHMSKNGYSAVRDINDKYVSGYMVKNPLVVFDAKNVAVETVRKLEDTEINKAFNSHAAKIGSKAAAQALVPYAGAGVGMLATKKAISSKTNDKIVSDYREKHPNSELTYAEILRNYQKSQYA